ncbi:MAG: 3-coathanger stack domain-containing protein [Pseudomonadota bacterium]
MTRFSESEFHMAKINTLVGLLFVLLIASPALGEMDVLLRDAAVVSGTTAAYTASRSITAGPSYVVENGATLSLYAGQTITLLPGFHAQAGSAVLLHVTGEDAVPPTILSAYPADADVIASQGNPVTLLIAFSDAHSGIRTVTLLDGLGNDISTQAIIDGDSLEYVIDATGDADYSFTIIIEDLAGNTVTKVMSFRIDATIPVTTVDTAGEQFTDPVSISFGCSEDATIYYSTDGYPPFIGAANTIVLPAAAAALTIDGTTRLTYFAVDAAGNVEETKSVVYYFDDIPPTVTELSATYNAGSDRIELAWQVPAVPVASYQLYRAISLHDLKILEDSRTGGYRPPERLRLAAGQTTGTSFNDTDIMPGITYWYGVTVIDALGQESLISWLVNATSTAVTTAQTREEAIAKALTWLEAYQQPTGFWGNSRRLKTIATIHALDLFRQHDVDSAGIRSGVYALRGAPALNNDFLARRIATLSSYGQNVDAEMAQLIVNAHRIGDQLNGWGIQKNYFPDPVDIVLGAKAVEQSGTALTFPNECYNSLRDWHAPLNENYNIRSAEADKFAWVNLGEPSIYASAMAYAVMDAHYRDDAPVIDYQWIIDAQQEDGSLGGSLMDTAGVLLWLDIPESARTAAVGYLVSQQAADGSWDASPFTTALCAKALTAAHPFGHKKHAFGGSDYAFSIFKDGWDFAGDDFTFTMKVKLVDDGRRFHGLASQNQSWRIHYDRLYNIIALNAADGSVSFNTNALGDLLFDGSTHTVEVNRTGSLWRIWVDGSLQSYYTNANAMPDLDRRRYIGRVNLGSGWDYLNGEIEIIMP